MNEYVSQMKLRVDCLRENGLAELADPTEYGQILIDQSKLSDPAAIDRALNACSEVGNVPMPPEVRRLTDRANSDAVTDEQKEVFKEYAQCMQESGAPDFPDPEPDGLPGDQPWDQAAPGAAAATAECAPIIGDPVNQGPGVG